MRGVYENFIKANANLTAEAKAALEWVRNIAVNENAAEGDEAAIAGVTYAQEQSELQEDIRTFFALVDKTPSFRNMTDAQRRKPIKVRSKTPKLLLALGVGVESICYPVATRVCI